MNIKVGYEYGIYNFINMSLSWIGMVCELQASKVGYIETVSVFDLAKNAKSQNSP
jgi:hypothetical protein